MLNVGRNNLTRFESTVFETVLEEMINYAKPPNKSWNAVDLIAAGRKISFIFVKFQSSDFHSK